MSFNWDDFPTEESVSSQSQAFDWGEFPTSNQAIAPHMRTGDQGKFLGGLTGRAINFSRKHPSHIGSEALVGATQIPENLMDFIFGISSRKQKAEEKGYTPEQYQKDPQTRGFRLDPKTGKPYESFSKIIASKFREDLPEEDREEAQSLADLVELGGSLIPWQRAAKALTPKSAKFKDLSVGKLPAIQPKAPKVKDTFESGLTKPRYVDSKKPNWALLTPTQKKQALARMNQEAVDIAKRSSSKNPLSEKIKEGFDFNADYEKRFGELKAVAKKFNPEVDTTPLNRFLVETQQEYAKVRNPSPEVTRIRNEIARLRKNPHSGLDGLLKEFRSNNAKSRTISQTKRLSGDQMDYDNFLRGMNKSIDESLSATFPEGEGWLKNFRDLNKEYGQYKRAQAGMDYISNTLEPIVEGSLSPSTFNRLSYDTKKQKALSQKVGKDMASDLIQLSKDVSKARNALNKIPVKELSVWEKYLPFSGWIPGIGKVLPFVKAHSYAKRGYGYWLSQPAKRRALDKAAKAVQDVDLIAYAEAAQELSS